MSEDLEIDVEIEDREFLYETILEVLKNIEYEYFLISPAEVIANQKGVLSLGGTPIDSGNKLQRVVGNRNLLKEYINHASELGWNLVTTFDFEGIPHHGCFVFRRIKGNIKGDLPIGQKEEYPVETPEEKMARILSKRPKRIRKETTEVSDKAKTKSVKKTINLENRYAKETGKNAIWHGSETKQFQDWKKTFMERVKSGEPIKDEVSKKD